jgi:hypothetical protein
LGAGEFDGGRQESDRVWGALGGQGHGRDECGGDRDDWATRKQHQMQTSVFGLFCLVCGYVHSAPSRMGPEILAGVWLSFPIYFPIL